MSLDLRDRLNRSPIIRPVSQAALIALLIVIVVLGTHSIDKSQTKAANEKATAQIVQAALARTCESTSLGDLRKEGLIAECREAKAGNIVNKVPKEAVASAKADPKDVNPDVIPDKVAPSPTPGTIDVNPLIATSVDQWFRTHDLSLTPGYTQALKTSIAQVLTKHPGLRGKGRKPTQAQISAAATAALLANPPADGVDGANGRGIASTTLDGCDVVFTYTDSTTSRIGPLCGPKGDAPTKDQLVSAVADYCTGDTCKGYPVSFTLADGETCTDTDGDHRYDCALPTPPPVEPTETPTGAAPGGIL